MSEFVTALREQLVDAAEREQARRLPRLQAPGPRLVLGLAAAAALVLIVVLAGALDTRVVDRGERPAARPTPERRDLFGGTLEPGVPYRTTEFQPPLGFEVADDRWMAVDTTLADELRLIRVDRGAPAPEPPRIQQLVFQRVTEVADPSVRGLAASLTAAPPDLYAWLREHPDLRVGQARAVVIAGVQGATFDVRVAFDRPAHADPWCARHELFTCTYLAPGLTPPDGARLRITVLRTDPQPLVITLGGLSARDLAAVEEAARPVLESLTVTGR